MLRIVPEATSPNLLTFLGNSFSFLVGFALLLGDLPIVGQTHRAVFLLPPVGLFLYMALDNAEGLQARRTGTSSPLGEFCDHWLDAFNVFLIPLGIIAVSGIHPTRALPILLLAILGCWAIRWEDRERAGFVLPRLGDVEGIGAVMSFYLICSSAGLRFWETTLLGVPFIDIFALAAVLGLSSAFLGPMIRCSGKRWHLLGLAASVTPLVAYFVIAYPRVEPGAHRLIYVLIGLAGALHIGDLMRAKLIGTRYRAFDLGLVAFGVLLNATLFMGPTMRSGRVQLGLVLACVVFVSLKLLYQFFHTKSFVTRELGINLLTLTPEQKARIYSARAQPNQEAAD